MMEKLLEVKNLSFSYPASGVNALAGVSFCARPGEIIMLMGPSGSGKSTLLSCIGDELLKRGESSGEVIVSGSDVRSLSGREKASLIGMIGQNPEDGTVTDKVWHELAFGPENLGMPQNEMRLRVAEISQFFGIAELFHRDVNTLSGGQKQQIKLASAMILRPEILLLDEPFAQLDTKSREQFADMLLKLRRELGTTVIMVQQDPEAAYLADRILFLDGGRLVIDADTRSAVKELSDGAYAPTAARVYNGLLTNAKAIVRGLVGKLSPDCDSDVVGGSVSEADMVSENEIPPLDVNEGRRWIKEFARKNPPVKKEFAGEVNSPQTKPGSDNNIILSAKNLWFKYDGDWVLRGLSLELKKGEILCVAGGNGSGKTTLLDLLGGLKKSAKGKISLQGKIALLPQNPELLFMTDDINGRHPYDLSGGEKQQAALDLLLETKPDILLLDEPTKGLDPVLKEEFIKRIKSLSADMGIIMVSHDTDMIAEAADRCLLLFDGNISAEADTRKFFSDNYFYTTTVNRMTRDVLPGAVTVKDVYDAWLVAEYRDTPRDGEDTPIKPRDGEDGPYKTRDENKPDKTGQTTRRFLSYICLLLIPLTVAVGVWLDVSYLPISFLIIVECGAAFALDFEGRNVPASEIVVLAILAALAVAGRIVMIAFPEIKPVTAFTVIAGAVFGGGAGFFVGAVSMLASNIVFGQGAWTPWQMFAMGLTGFIAGLLFYRRRKTSVAQNVTAEAVRETEGKTLRLSGENKPEKSDSRKFKVVLMAIYGFFSAVIIYGGIMNPAAAILAGFSPDKDMLIAYWAAGLPLDIMHGIATAVLLVVFGEGLLKKLDRVKLKYYL